MSADIATLDVYAAHAEHYDRLAALDAKSRALEGFLMRLAPGASILDLGCGPGRHAARMKARGFDVVAWDACAEFVETARARGVNAYLRKFSDLDARDAYDAVWANFSLLHAPKAAFPGHLAAVARALRPKGFFYLGLRSGEGEGRDALGRYHARYTRPELETLLRDAGFRILQVTTGRSTELSGEETPHLLVTARHG